MEYEIALGSVVRLAFDLTPLFRTPVQPNIDNCGREPWPQNPTYVPLINVEGRPSATVSYRAWQLPGGTAYTEIISSTTAADAPGGSAALTVGCSSGGLFMLIGNVRKVEGNRTDVVLTIGDRPSETSSWDLGQYGGGDLRFVSSQDASRLMAQLRGASSVKVEIPASSLEAFSFDLSGVFETPVQGNLDECGYYKPGETRAASATKHIRKHSRAQWRCDENLLDSIAGSRSDPGYDFERDALGRERAGD